MSTLERVNAMPHIDEAYRDSDGYWAITKPGYYLTGDGCHSAHEQTAREFLRACRDVAPCDCCEQSK